MRSKSPISSPLYVQPCYDSSCDEHEPILGISSRRSLHPQQVPRLTLQQQNDKLDEKIFTHQQRLAYHPEKISELKKKVLKISNVEVFLQDQFRIS
ncbi:unnamed protein product [Didymodactylos carnosus]|uniref:Uncharacterized protein n=1 Tax=Didymodactylos carnosus TaxID=1234261 RepID=A0A814JX56_9BILA|nr:unnamed protein product [Didymodactylos carnosus]CAF1041469.1 unnamed protein product [Didymodactylos carnosus]CAF3673092.1 unnamed protein product [Didymodactylos carnosus]CAF3811672.1 unnamed protein product [Didymodactylos carnosus]